MSKRKPDRVEEPGVKLMDLKGKWSLAAVEEALVSERPEPFELGSALYSACASNAPECVRRLMLELEPGGAGRDAASAALWAAASSETDARECAAAVLALADPLWDDSAALRRAACGGNMGCLRLILAAGEHSEDALRLARSEARRNMREEAHALLDQAMSSRRQREVLEAEAAPSQEAARGPRL